MLVRVTTGRNCKNHAETAAWCFVEVATQEEGTRLIDSIRNIRMGRRRRKAEWCKYSSYALQYDTVTVSFGDEPGVYYRLHPTTGGIEPIAEEDATHDADSTLTRDDVQLPPRPIPTVAPTELMTINTTPPLDGRTTSSP